MSGPFFFFFKCQSDNNQIWAFLDASRTSTISELFKALVGQQPYLGFLDASITSTISGLLKVPIRQQPYLEFLRCQ